MQFQDIINDAKLSAAYVAAIETDGATDVAIRTSPTFVSVSDENYGASRSLALSPLYVQAIKAGVTDQQVEDWCYSKGIAKSVIDAIRANQAVIAQLQH